MGIEQKAVIRITAEQAEALKLISDLQKQLQTDFRSIANDAKKMSQDVSGSMGSMGKASSVLGSAWSKLKGAWLEITAVVTAAHFLKSWAMDSIEADKAFNQLRIQIEKLGISYDSVSDSVQKSIDATSRYAIVQSEDVAKILKQLIFITGDLALSQENLTLAYDLSYQAGISTSEAANILGKALTGNAEALGRIMPEFRNLDDVLGKNRTRAQETAYAILVLSEKVSGATEKMDEHEKAVLRVKAAWDNLTQSIGGKFIYAVDAVFGSLKSITNIFTKDIPNLVEVVGNAFVWLSDKLKIYEILTAQIPYISAFEKFIEESVANTVNNLKKIYDGIISPIIYIAEKLDITKEKVVDAAKATGDAIIEVNKAVNEYGKETEEVSKKVKVHTENQEKLKRAFDDVIESFRERAKEEKLSGEDIIRIEKKIADAIDKTGDVSKFTKEQMAKATKALNAQIESEIKAVKEQVEVEKKAGKDREAIIKDFGEKQKAVEVEILKRRIEADTAYLKDLKARMVASEAEYKSLLGKITTAELEAKALVAATAKSLKKIGEVGVAPETLNKQAFAENRKALNEQGDAYTKYGKEMTGAARLFDNAKISLEQGVKFDDKGQIKDASEDIDKLKKSLDPEKFAETATALQAASDAIDAGKYAEAVEILKSATLNFDVEKLRAQIKTLDEIKTAFDDIGTAAKDDKTVFEGTSISIKKAVTTALTEIQTLAMRLETELATARVKLSTEASASAKNFQAEVGTVEGKIKTVVDMKKELEFEILVKGYEDALAKKAELEKPTSSVHTIYIRQVPLGSNEAIDAELSQYFKGLSEGGDVQPIKAAGGRHFSGYGGGDRIPILGEAGEYMMRKESVRSWGKGLFDMLNSVNPSAGIRGLSNASGASSGAMEKLAVDLNLGGKTFGMTTDKSTGQDFAGQIKKLNILRGRYKQPY